jgi:hypothetical protein
MPPAPVARTSSIGSAQPGQPHPPKLTRECRKLTCSALSLSARIAAHRRGLASGLLTKLHCKGVHAAVLTLPEAVTWALPL